MGDCIGHRMHMGRISGDGGNEMLLVDNVSHWTHAIHC